MLDSLGSQRYTEQQIIYMRQVKNLEHNLDSLDEKRKALEASMSVSQLEAGVGKLQAGDSEAARMTDFASATHDSQTRVAQESAEHAVKQSLIENDRDQQLMKAELDANRRLVELDQRYTLSIQSAHSQTEKAKLQGELEVEKAKAEAQKKKAIIEAQSTGDISRLEQDYQSRISNAQHSAAAFNQAATQQSQSQRIKVALANADARRRVQADMAATQDSVTTLEAEKVSAAQPLHDQISKLNEQIIALQGRVTSIESGFDSKIAVQRAKLNGFREQNEQLAEVEQSLINAPVMTSAQPLGDSGSRDVQRLEGELKQATRTIMVRKANQLAEVDQQLSRDLDALAGRLSNMLTTAPSASTEATASISKAASESAIRSELAEKRTQINNDARSQIAELTVKSEIAKASVVAPVLTNRAVYSGSYGDKPAAFAATDSKAAREFVAKAKTSAKPVAIAKAAPSAPAIQPGAQEDAGVAPLIVASSFEPRTPRPSLGQVDDVVIATGVMAGGNLKPLVVAPRATTYTVVYRYSEKGSADKFMEYLRAYGVNDFTYLYSDKLRQHVLVMGKYTSKDQAAGRVAFLNRTTTTSNAQVVEADF
ncbi:hypothetical protein NPS53_08570 [Pseudomonas putida]|uniref:hypothetical protein n=1 Tax=Pseudomonas putida TaxID=303 RepID=UPI002363CA97|nr:hypothetical protein [Pseudomonas putida]MDD2139626.1 hypothetical protein [Pseudomonas putida]HDS1721549.1 hypothetical protein [Pseudomonas putida]